MKTMMMVLFLALQTADQEMTRIEEWTKTQPDTGPGHIGIGDEYYKASKKFPKEKAKFMDKAIEHWSKGWTDLDPVWKAKTRESMKKIFFVSGAKKVATGWKGDKVTVSGECVHSGQFAARIPLKRNADIGTDQFKYDLSLPRGVKEVVVSAWVFSDSTDENQDTLKPSLFTFKGELKQGATPIPCDYPVWNEVKCTVDATGCAKMTLMFEFASRTGTVYIDDISVKADGQELMPNGGFEK